MNTVKLTQALISIPSWVDKQTDEQKIGQFVYGCLKQFPWLKVKKQPVKNGRFNLIAQDQYPTKLLLIGHMDTVEPKQGWQTNQLKGIIKNNKIYGLGATDMKGSLAAILNSLKNLKQTKGLMLLFYVDEEYDFLGTKKFLKEYQNKIKPKLIVSGDGGNLKLGLGCRGLVEIAFKIQGISAHAANPNSGKNAILGSFAAIKKLEKYNQNFSSQQLGKTTLNLAYLQGGLNLGQDRSGKQIYGKQANNIPDLAQLVLELRTASSKLKARKITKQLNSFLKENGFKLLEPTVRHDLIPWLTKKTELKRVISLLQKEGIKQKTNPGKRGFIDLQMFWQAFNQIPCLTFGPGEENLAHKANEFVSINQLKKAERVFNKIISQLTN